MTKKKTTQNTTKKIKKSHLFQRIAKIVLFLILALLLLSLCGCSKTEPISHTIADNAVAATTALEQQLPKDCITDAIATQITVIKTEIRAVKSACDTEKNQITNEKLRWKLSFWTLVGIVAAYILHKLLK